MKIIHLILGKARPERMNGVSKVAHNLAVTQTQLGHEVELWGITPNPKETVAERVYPTRFFQAERGFRLAADLQSALASLPKQGVCVHVHGGFIPPFYTATRKLKKLGIPYVFTPHGSYSPVAFRRGKLKKKLYFRLLESRMVKDARALHLLGRMAYEHAEQLQPQARRVLIPNGQSLEELKFSPSPLPRPEGPLFSYCGRLINHYKGLDILLAGFGLYREEGGQGQLWLIGDGPDRARLEEQARELGVGEKVKFWGSRYGEEKLNLLDHSDAFAHPSRSEGFPTGVLEAAGLGLPCLLTTETNVAEYIDRHEAGLHLPALTARAIADALHQVEAWKAEGGLDRISRNAREMVADSFSWEEIAQRLLEVYQGNDTHRSFPVTHRKTAALQG